MHRVPYQFASRSISCPTGLTQAMLAVFLLLAPSFLLRSATADAACHLYTADDPVPEEWGAAYNVFSTSREPLLRANCASSSVSLEAGSGSSTQYIYRDGFEWRNSRWNSFKFDGANTEGPWIVGKAHATLARTESEMSERSLFVAYVCTWTGTQWKCGCRNQNCSTNYWQLQAFRSVSTGGVAVEQSRPSPLPKEVFYPGAKFPSAEFAPIKEPYIFAHQTAPFPVPHDGFQQDLLHHVRPFNMNSEDNRGGRDYYDERQSKFRELGILPIFHMRIKNQGDNVSEVLSIQDQNRPGVAYDEFLNNSSPPTCPDWCQDAIAGSKQVESRDPSFFTWAWVSNVDRIIPKFIEENHDAFDIIVTEAYVVEGDQSWSPDILDKYINNIKVTGLEEKALIGLVGGWEGKGTPSESHLRWQMEKVRSELPRSPGLGLWGHWSLNDELLASGVYKRLIDDIWYNRSPTANITGASDGQSVSGTVDITVSGTPNSSTKKPIDHYRYFIDNTMVAESQHNTFRWNTGEYGKGNHTFTVHAVDEDALAGVDQVTLRVQ